MPKATLTIGDDERVRLRSLHLEREGEEDEPVLDADVEWQVILKEDDSLVASGSMAMYDSDETGGHYVGAISLADTALLTYRERYRVLATFLDSADRRHTIELEVGEVVAVKGRVIP